MAGKSENTKPAIPAGGKALSGTRETLSGVDISRECFTEIDMNIGTLSKMIYGVSSRTGRAGLEILIAGILGNINKGGCLLSLDVSGWSPNMWREL